MDGRVLILICVAMLGGAYLLGNGDVTIGPSAETPAQTARGQALAETRHDEIRSTLQRQGYDLDDPETYVREVDGRTVVGGPVAATEHLRTVFARSVVANYHRPLASDTPGQVRVARRVPACRFTPPADGSRVVNVYANQTPHVAPFYALTGAELDGLVAEAAEAAEGRSAITSALDKERAAGEGAAKADPFRYTVMELAITETDTPVHLVLQTGQGRVMWNLHMARGAKVTGVSLIGGHLPAIANLPPRVPVEAMSRTEMAACDVTPVRLPRATDPIFQEVDRGVLSDARAREGLTEMAQASDAWNVWFDGQFGIRSDETRIGFDEAAIMAVIGPVPQSPEDRVMYHTLERARVVMAEEAETISKIARSAENRLRRLVRDRAAQASVAATQDR